MQEPAAGTPWITGPVPPPAGVGGSGDTIVIVLLTGALVLPAMSVQVPVAVPLAVSVIGCVHDATPDNESAPVNVTVTGVVLWPLGSGSGLGVAVTVGAVLSTSTVNIFWLSTFPALSVA